jgi:diaminohydroxyphosphoribosylaminopyrimidine deaminase/5-amino-6-(5-phosphoribosylamino)uracil reductase
MKHEYYMRRCLQLARNGMLNAKPNPMVGAVIVSADDRIIGEGYHVRCGEGHAEVNAFASVKAEDEHLLKDATIYVSLEPCSHYGKTPPCADLIISKGVKRCVCGCVDPFAKVQGRGIRKLRDAGIEVIVGIIEKECLELNKRFITFNTHSRPYIILKWAQSVNGFIDDDFKAFAFSTSFTKMLSHKLRAENDAILVGRVTDEREHPMLNVREWHGKNPMRLVLTHDMDINEMMKGLYSKNIQSIIIEGGAKTLSSFLDSGLWDEIRVETSSVSIKNGTKAPMLPSNIKLADSLSVDGNNIKTYSKYTE